MLIDSHAHLTSSELFPNAEAILEKARLAGVDAIVNVATEHDQLLKGLELSKKHSHLFHAYAIHPHDVEQIGARDFPLVVDAARSGQLVAIGETGLDYHYHHSTVEYQKEYLKKHLELARETGLPVIIHCREAFHDFFEILKDYPEVKGVLHCFTGTIDEAKQVIERNFFISFSGIITFKKSEQLREVVRHMPLDRLLVETDAPFLAPQSHRGKLNEPAFVVEVAEVMAAVKGITVKELAKVTSDNCRRLFHISFK